MPPDESGGIFFTLTESRGLDHRIFWSATKMYPAGY